MALDRGCKTCEERLLPGDELTPDRRIDERRLGILVGEADGECPSAIIQCSQLERDGMGRLGVRMAGGLWWWWWWWW